MSKFKVGDRVKVNDNFPVLRHRGKVGTVVPLQSSSYPYSIRLDSGPFLKHVLECELAPLSDIPKRGDTVRVSYEAQWNHNNGNFAACKGVVVDSDGIHRGLPSDATIEVIKPAEPDWYTRDKAAVVDAYGVVWQRRSGRWLSTVGAPGNIANLVAGGAKLIYDPANDDK